MVVGLADEPHVRRDHVQVGAQLHPQALVDGALDGPDGHRRAVGQAARQLVDRRHELVGRHDPVDQADALGLGLDEVTGPHQLERLCDADEAGEKIGPAVAGMRPTLTYPSEKRAPAAA